MNRDCSNHQKFKNCPPKDIFKKFEKKADNHSTLVYFLVKIGEIVDSFGKIGYDF